MYTLLVCSIITYPFYLFSPDTLVPRVLKAKFSHLKLGQGHFSKPHPAFSYLWFLAWTAPSRNYSGKAPLKNAALWKHFNHFYVTMIDKFLKFCFYLNLWGKPWLFKLCFVTRFPTRIIGCFGCFVLMFIGFTSVCFYSLFSSLIVLFYYYYFWFLLSLLASGTLFGRLVVCIYET